MRTCKRYDFSDCWNEPREIIEYVLVTSRNAKKIRKSVPEDQVHQIEEGDEISVYAIDESSPDRPRRLTIWYNKEVAAIESSEGSIWGDWDEDEELLLTEELEEAQYAVKKSVSGRIAYTLFGQRGIFAAGNFYIFTDSVGEA